MAKILCFLFGHDDPIMNTIIGAGLEREDDAFWLWKKAARACNRCDKQIIPSIK